MEKYFKKKMKTLENSCVDNANQEIVPSSCVNKANIGESSTFTNSKRLQEDFDVSEIISDPGLRPLISDFHVNIRDQVRRAYWLKGPCQPRNHQFKWTYFGKDPRRFIGDWFNLYGDWLEYSVSKDAAFCLCCYLFRVDHGEQSGGNIFATTGWSYWKKTSKLQKHVGAFDSAHNVALRKCQLLIDQKSHITVAFTKQSDSSKADYRTRLIASIDVVRFLLRQGLPFRGHDESETSTNKGNFLELLEWLADHNDNVSSVSLRNAPENLKLTSPQIQKEIVSVIACEIREKLILEIGEEPFSILIDESRDISIKEQMAIIFRYVDKKGCVIECFFAIIHVSDTTALSLKTALDMLFSTHGLSISRLRGQGYDGASNMQGIYNGLKSLILRENESAHYVHCFAHQLQLALIGVANNDCQIAMLFSLMTSISNIVGASCQRRDSLREKEVARITAGLSNGEICSGHGLNQETNIKRAGDTRWSSHYNSILSLILMFSSVVDVLDDIRLSGTDFKKRAEASSILTFVQTYEFVFNLHMMKTILGMTNDLSQALQKKDQNIVNAMHLVKITKAQLQMFRDSGWESLITEVNLFCTKHQIETLDMNASFRALGRSRRKVEERTNLHHYRVNVFYSVIDLQLNELNHRFNEVNTELLICMTCFDPSENFSAFDIQKLLRLAKFYPSDFSQIQLMTLQSQLETYVLDVRSRVEFSDLNGISDLAKQFVRMKLDITYPLVYSLIKLVLLLPVATATVERAFSAMKIIKTRLRNRMNDEWLNDSLLTYIERETFKDVDNEAIIKRFQAMKNRRVQI